MTGTSGLGLDLTATGFARPAEPMTTAGAAKAETAAPDATQTEELAHRRFRISPADSERPSVEQESTESHKRVSLREELPTHLGSTTIVAIGQRPRHVYLCMLDRPNLPLRNARLFIMKKITGVMIST